jgi:hypothetical protein
MSETPPPTVGYWFFRCDDDDCDVTVRVPIPQGDGNPASASSSASAGSPFLCRAGGCITAPSAGRPANCSWQLKPGEVTLALWRTILLALPGIAIGSRLTRPPRTATGSLRIVTAEPKLTTAFLRLATAEQTSVTSAPRPVSESSAEMSRGQLLTVNAQLAATGKASVTIGLAELEANDALEDLLARADQALYRERQRPRSTLDEDASGPPDERTRFPE